MMEILETEVDPLYSLISQRLESIARVIVFASGKGGVGKSTISTHMAYLLSKKYRTGILDLDLHGPSVPLILGITDGRIKEGENGIIPPALNALRVMSLGIFIGGRGSPLRGNSKNEIVREMFAITDFGDLDFLVVDMPPGTGDEFLTALEIFRMKGEMIFITSPSTVSWQVTKRAIDIAKGRIRNGGVIINMGRNDSIVEECKRTRIKCLGNIEYYPYVVDGTISYLEKTEYFGRLNEIVEKIIH